MAWLFDEVNDYVTLAANSVLNLPDGDWTIAGWVKLTDNAGTANQYILSSGVVNTTPSLNLYAQEASHPSSGNRDESQTWLRDDDGTSGILTSTGQPWVSNTSWTHIVLLRSGTTVYQLTNNIVDGFSTLTSLDAITMSSGLWLGASADLDSTLFLGGAMAEWAKWNRVLLDSERAALAKGFAPAFFRRSLQWYLPMRRNYVEYQNNITVTNNGTTITAHPNIVYPTGPYIIRSGVQPGTQHSFVGSGAVSFDGSATLQGSTIAIFSGSGAVSMDGDTTLNMNTVFGGSGAISMDGDVDFSGEIIFPGASQTVSFDGDVALNMNTVFAGGESVNMNGSVTLSLKHRFAGSGAVSMDGDIDLTGGGWLDVDEPFGPTWSNAT